MLLQIWMSVKNIFGTKIRYFDGLNTILRVFGNAFCQKKLKGHLLERGAFIRINTVNQQNSKQ